MIFLYSKNCYVYLILNVFLLYFFVAVISYLGIWVDKDIVFVTPDSHTYFDVGKWLFYGTPTEELMHRPFLFPLILFSSITFGGIKGYFLLQFTFWLCSANLLFAALHKFFKSIIISTIGVILLVSNLSFLMMTFHALTEVFVIFLTTLFIFVFSFLFEGKRKDNTMLMLLCLLILLSVTRPMFFYFTIVAFAIILPVLIYKYKYKYYRSLKKNLLIIIILFPLLFQIGIMKSHFNTFNISTIGSYVFRGYLFQRTYAIENNITNRTAALKEIENIPDNALIPYILNHKKSFLKAYFLNMYENVNAYSPSYLEYKKDSHTGNIIYEGKAACYMRNLNSIYFYLHILFFFPIFFIFLQLFNMKEFNTLTVFFMVLCFLFYGLLFSSSISFEEGDRLVLPTLPVWIVLYLTVIFKFKEYLPFNTLKHNKMIIDGKE